jgi:hypothetical protein
VLVSLLANTIFLAQKPRQASPTVAELIKNIALVHRTNKGDAEKLIGETAQQLVAFLKAHELSAATAKRLGLYFSAAPEDVAHFRGYMFKYHSGGTRGVVTIPVFQWRNAAGKRFVYRFNGEAAFVKIYRLASPGRTLYLLLGGDNGDSRCYNDMAYVAELKGDYLLLDNPAFGSKPALELCNVDRQFDARH